MAKTQIVTRDRGADFIAHLAGRPECWDAGKTEAEAIRQLRVSFPTELTGPPYKVITLTQPWALLCVLLNPETGKAEKQVETRSRLMNFRGELLIHAAAGFPAMARDLLDTEPFASVLARHGYLTWRDLPTGVILGGALMTGCVSTNRTEEIDRIAPPHSQERAFGKYGRDRYALRLDDAWRLEEPVPAKGHQSLPWNLPDEIGRDVLAGHARALLGLSSTSLQTKESL